MESTLRARSGKVRKAVHGFMSRSSYVLAKRRKKGRHQIAKV